MPQSYKPIAEADLSGKPRGAPRRLRKRYLLLFVSLLFNVLSFAIILRWRSHDLTGLFSHRMPFGDSWYGGLSEGPASVPTTDNPGHSSETLEIEKWLEAPERQLNLTRAKNSIASDNVIFNIEKFYPRKEETIAYLENPRTSFRPNTQARVTLHHGGWKEPVVKDYIVGPLPIGTQTTIRPLTEIYHRNDIPFNARGLSHIMELVDWLADAVRTIRGSIKGALNDTLIGGMNGPFSFDGSFRRVWMTWRRNAPGSWIMPVNFYQYIDTSGTDISQWKILKLIYHNQTFPTTESFLEAFNNGTLIRHIEQADPNVDLSWAGRTRIGTERDLEYLPGPRSVSFAGVRYRVDMERQYVSWMGWGMYLGFDRDMGLNLWDIRFRGERVIYQLAPQEAIAQYGGNDPVQATTAWLDRYFGMGAAVRDMVPHYDCPQEAVYLPASTYSMMGTVHVQRAICIFEQDTGKPLSRHTGDEEGEFGAVKSYVLTVRSTTTFDYLFYLDGTIEVRLSASGYMQGGYWQPNQDAYGGRIRDTSMGNLHDHVINYKVDFDIAGTTNSLLRTTTEVEEVTHPWLDDDWGQQHIQQKIVKEYIASEDDALLKHPPNFQGGYAMVNQDVKNRWGYPRGYAIHPGNSPIHNTVIGSKRLLHNANWARYNLAVSRRKETEPSSSSMWNLQLSGAPAVDFHKFFDGENITQQDLVAWINLGMHHLPSAEDSPNTKTNIATSSFMLTPLNYFDSDISMELKNAILLRAPEKAGSPYSYDDYGVKQDFNCLPEPPSPFDYTVTPENFIRVSDVYLRVKMGF
ncbi:amine oxidase catalytic domain-containing protein [Gymnopilus junonius]|uniref:Amine oxidase n=1 Tax=Gymnopilus junonius TaxID=109634 RepID=A0A9P5NIM4_GYMJU|nr:amine oxidase catalytic domain-containing protein [Gymnopilus junonius]